MLIATLCALGAAVLHASWNLALKQGVDRFTAAALQFLAGGIIFLPVVVFFGPPTGQAALCLAASSIIHLGYVAALVRAYGAGDFSMAYPLARGSGALLAALGGALFFADTVAPVAAIGMVIAGLGLFSLMQFGGTRAAYLWALGTGVLISSYTLVDTVGARQSNGISYAATQSLCAGLLLSGAAIAMGRREVLFASARHSWRRHCAAGAAATVSYGLVLVAVRFAPVGYVAVLRETSVVLGPIGGWFILHERLGARRAAAALVVLAGMAVLVAAR